VLCDHHSTTESHSSSTVLLMDTLNSSRAPECNCYDNLSNLQPGSKQYPSKWCTSYLPVSHQHPPFSCSPAGASNIFRTPLFQLEGQSFHPQAQQWRFQPNSTGPHIVDGCSYRRGWESGQPPCCPPYQRYPARSVLMSSVLTKTIEYGHDM
jgi:hypothetical protein